MATLKDDLVPVVDAARAIAGELGFRPFQVWVRVTTYAGTRVGQGASSYTDTRLLVGGGQNPRVREVRRKDVIAGSNTFVDAQYDIGPLTPQFPGGGTAESVVDPQRPSSPTEVHYLIKGRNLPATGLLCQKIESSFDRPLRTTIRVRSIGVAAA